MVCIVYKTIVYTFIFAIILIKKKNNYYYQIQW
jgi:hypothetical protein